MEQVDLDEVISKLIAGTYEEFCENIVVLLKIVSTYLELLQIIIFNSD